MSRKLLICILAFMVLTVPCLSACNSRSDEVYELTYSIFFPSTHYHSILGEQWAEEIAERTDGRVQITVYPGGSLVAAADTYSGIVDGIADIGMSVLAYSMGRFPATELVDLPHGYPSGWVATKVANDFYREFTPEEFNDVKVMYFHAHGPGIVLTTDKPVRELEDMKGLVLRSTGVGAQIAEALGATGYAAGQGDAYELMSKGTIDGSVTPLEVLKGWNQAEVVKYATRCIDVGYTANMFVVMNRDKWDSLPADIQETIEEINQEWIEKHALVWSYYDQSAIDYFLTFENRELIELSSDEMNRWVEAASVVKDAYMAEKGSTGLPVNEYEDYINQRVQYWSSKDLGMEQAVQWVETELESGT